MDRERVLEHFLNSVGKLNSRYVNSSEKNKDEWFHAVTLLTHFLEGEPSLSFRIKALKEGFREHPKCPICLKLIPCSGRDWKKYCSMSCFRQSREFKESFNKVDKEAAKAKRKDTMLERYGYCFNSQRPEVKKSIGSFQSRPEYREKISNALRAKNSHIDYSLLNVENIVEMNKTMSLEEISEVIGCSKSAVHHVLRNAGLFSNCHLYASRPEKMVRDMISDPVECNIKYLINPWQIDVYVPSKKLAIEVNGIYWHSEESGKDMRYHLNKTLRCLEKDVTLLHFLDIEVLEKPEIVKSMINVRLNRANRIYARKCKVSEITMVEAREFFNKTHLQGFIGGSKYVALKLNGSIVCAAIFGKPRFDKKYEVELLRFSSILNTVVVGGLSRLLKVSGFSSVVSYADRRYSTGQGYVSAGFQFVRTTRPGYKYVKNGVLYSRQMFMKSKLRNLPSFDENKTEWQIMKEEGYSKLWDCGNLVYVWLSN